MKNGTCVKCQSDEVFVMRGNEYNRLYILFGWKRVAMLHYYICADCGYTEIYVHKDEDMNYIREKFDYADGRKKKRKNDE